MLYGHTYDTVIEKHDLLIDKCIAIAQKTKGNPQGVGDTIAKLEEDRVLFRAWQELHTAITTWEQQDTKVVAGGNSQSFGRLPTINSLQRSLMHSGKGSKAATTRRACWVSTTST